MNFDFRWFVRLEWEDEVFDATPLSKNCESLYGEGGAEALLGHVLRKDQSQGLMIPDHMLVALTLIKAWSSYGSFRPKDGEEPPAGSGSKLGRCKVMKRSNATQESKPDPDSRRMPLRRGDGMVAILSFLQSLILDPLPGIGSADLVSQPCGRGQNTEVRAALELADEDMRPAKMLVRDRGYDTRKFKETLKDQRIRPHSRTKSQNSSPDGRATSKPAHKESMKLRSVVEGFFGWLKTSGSSDPCPLREFAPKISLNLRCAPLACARVYPIEGLTI